LTPNAAALATLKLYTNRLLASGTWVFAMIIVFFPNWLGPSGSGST
jgi:hypothetical protein